MCFRFTVCYETELCLPHAPFQSKVKCNAYDAGSLVSHSNGAKNATLEWGTLGPLGWGALGIGSVKIKSLVKIGGVSNIVAVKGQWSLSWDLTTR